MKPFFSRILLCLRLGRASNLPTLWTNTLVASALAGGNLSLVALLAGSLLYLAGCTWNDAKDARWDAQHRPSRPIPAGEISQKAVWLLGSLQAALGLGLLATLNWWALGSGMLTLAAIAIYTWLHKLTAWAVVAMAWCRVQWVLTVLGVSLPPGGSSYLIALAACILGISLAARREALRGTAGDRRMLAWAPWGVLLVVGIAWVGAAPSGLLEKCPWLIMWLVWMMVAARTMARLGKAGIGTFVARALAGICLLDAAFLAHFHPAAALWASAAFILAWAAQKWVPAT